ncbi:hypothetical protein CXF83_10715 [Shewanella sp. Choline-02u-19]|uniref:hypothetical protein n=1 Tax=unclassified Shewanella TaxID=196818 RepID=UPI000C31F254|nr:MULTISPECIES: hypothetical protein [unclassified Shewanella]PKG75816.1 hypothetical protein CXF86_05110 [Shewanella sp. GutCb]PKH59292.1 hypothetical protein CXF84_04320 [Shewanella sp. Bg11-22]PKI27167.1 hypothetical protein CXF83_10715 [Shewanella sp. Choline-02u-19]
MSKVIRCLFCLSIIISSFSSHAEYIVEVTLDINGMYQGKQEIGLQESKTLKKTDDTVLLLISQSYVHDNYATLNYTVIEYLISDPETRNELKLPSISTLVNNEASLSLGDDLSYSVTVREVNK